MAKKATSPPRHQAKRKIGHYTHPDKKRANNPPVGLVTPETDRDAGKKNYAYDPHIDPALQWAGKAERTSFEIQTVSLHVHERKLEHLAESHAQQLRNHATKGEEDFERYAREMEAARKLQAELAEQEREREEELKRDGLDPPTRAR